MKNIFGLFIVVMSLTSCSNSERLVVHHQTVVPLTADDSLFVKNVLKMDGGKKYYIMKFQKDVYLTIKHKDHDNMYVLGSDGFIKNLLELYPDGRIVEYGPEFE